MVASLSVMQAFDHTTAALPSALLSTQTEGFGTPKKLATNHWIKETMDHWHLIPDLDFNGALIGYLGNGQIVNQVQQILNRKLGNQVVLIDPVMADRGALYPGLDEDYVRKIKALCKSAQIITPNWTELCLLSGMPAKQPFNEENIEKALTNLQQAKINAHVVVTGVQRGSLMGCMFESLEEGFEFIGNPTVDGHFYGTGDTFAALVLGFLQDDNSLTDAVHLASEAIYQAVQETAANEPTNNWRYGLKMGKLVDYIRQHVKK